ncbi:Phosphoglycerol transferase I [Dyadobacter sp. CECT 9275]|uniref:Phosphoglycerol transferase I n=1 Tax=Dyadobacter helix TaxID=2822344 RepID=A0A916JIK5_9BACT|nr:LTA synthase family protein [Dyadobacter sp. CECT 9275]CAG5016411.1 Phosphoglycerol transferase I [Dyadobacter sp. CECT 9275]
MRSRLQFLVFNFLCWILLFQFFRIVFLAYHFRKALELPATYWMQSAWHGLQMDISFAGYILAIPTLLMAATSRKWNWYNGFINVYNITVGLVIVLLVSVDLELFRAWGFRIDGSSLHYLQTPREAWASMSSSPVLLLCTLAFFLFLLVYVLLNTIRKRTISQFTPANILVTLLAFLVLTATLIIPIRGGFQLAPMNQSTVFFSNKSFANYAAVNVPWNYASSILNDTYSKDNPFLFFKENDADATVRSLYKKENTHLQMVNSGEMNVIVIIWESFSAKIVKSLGGLPNVTPQFDALAKEGILFTNMYASGNRSDKGMVAILSGYPAQPTQSIIKIPTKTVNLPSLPKSFHKAGYYTSFYYGGETEFANMKSYFLQQGFDKITDINSFDKKDMNSKWGAHDHVVLSRMLHDLDHTKQPFFSTLFTLSSHEPFEVPVPTVVKGNSQEKLFLNAHHYTDASIADFIRQAKTKPWWDHTLIVILADHGHPLPETSHTKPSEFYMPMLWLGGAVAQKGIRVDSLCSQTDLAATLLNQVNISSSEFVWSNDIFNHGRTAFAYFAFNNGFGWMKPEGYLVRDNLGGHITEQKGKIKAAEAELGKAYLQSSFTDYLKR